MIKIRLWGDLAQLTPNEFEVDVANWAQLFSAIESAHPTFRSEFLKNNEYVFAVVRNGELEYLDEHSLALPLNCEQMHIIPRAEGAAAAFAGWAATAVATAFGATAATFVVYWAAYIVATVAISMAIGAIVSMLAPKPETGGGSERADQQPSFAFSGAVNITAPGYPIPIVFGECITGSVVISVGVSAEELPVA